MDPHPPAHARRRLAGQRHRAGRPRRRLARLDLRPVYVGPACLNWPEARSRLWSTAALGLPPYPGRAPRGQAVAATPPPASTARPAKRIGGRARGETPSRTLPPLRRRPVGRSTRRGRRTNPDCARKRSCPCPDADRRRSAAIRPRRRWRKRPDTTEPSIEFPLELSVAAL